MKEHIRHNIAKTTVHTVEWKIKPKEEGMEAPLLVNSKWYMTQKSSGFPVLEKSDFSGNKSVIEITGGSPSCECTLVNEVKDSEGMVYKMEYFVNTYKDKPVVVEQPKTVSSTVSKTVSK